MKTTKPTPEHLTQLRRLSKDLRALSALIRLRVLATLKEEESNVAELGAELRISQPLLSWHLKELRLAGFVNTRRSGRKVLYRLCPEKFLELERELEALLGYSP
ncbi:MAG: ArsR family transcriptional regulator [Chloroflexi bacterium]|nr:MAG: ArsR family transcriptional regulator [Chloroflexota bacterium]